MDDNLEQLLKNLKLYRIQEILDRELKRAARREPSYAAFLARLLREQWAYRQERSLAYRIDRAQLPEPWTLESFPFKQQRGVRKTTIRQLAELDFIARAENIVFIGETGVGKTGLAIGLLRKALENGYRGLFIKAQDLFDEMYASLADRSSRRLLNRLMRMDVLLIDEMGYLNLRPEQSNIFFKLMEERYNRKATIITTNLLCGAPHNRFNAVRIVMRTPASEIPAVPLLRVFFSPHNDTCCQRRNEFVACTETP